MQGAFTERGLTQRSTPSASPPKRRKAADSPPEPQKSSKRNGTLEALVTGGSKAERVGPPSGVLEMGPQAVAKPRGCQLKEAGGVQSAGGIGHAVYQSHAPLGVKPTKRTLLPVHGIVACDF